MRRIAAFLSALSFPSGATAGEVRPIDTPAPAERIVVAGDAVLPSEDRRSIVTLTARGSDGTPLPGPVAHRIATLPGIIASATENGNLFAIVP